MFQLNTVILLNSDEYIYFLFFKLIRSRSINKQINSVKEKVYILRIEQNIPIINKYYLNLNI